MLSDIREKIQALIEDKLKRDFETFTYQSGDKKFILAESNIVTIVKVTKNGVALGSGQYAYDSSTNELEITATLVANDIIIVSYTYRKYSNTELDEYIRASLVWISYFAYDETDYELESENVYPTPSNRDTDLIALVSSILIRPDYTRYSLPNLTVVYNNKLTKDQKIQKLISRFRMGLGVNDVLNL